MNMEDFVLEMFTFKCIKDYCYRYFAKGQLYELGCFLNTCAKQVSNKSKPLLPFLFTNENKVNLWNLKW